VFPFINWGRKEYDCLDVDCSALMGDEHTAVSRGPVPLLILFRQETFSVPGGLAESCLTKNRTDEQQTASNFLTPWNSPPPHDCEIPFSFQRHW
jgi:hypothetical protein